MYNPIAYIYILHSNFFFLIDLRLIIIVNSMICIICKAICIELIIIFKQLWSIMIISYLYIISIVIKYIITRIYNILIIIVDIIRLPFVVLIIFILWSIIIMSFSRITRIYFSLLFLWFILLFYLYLLQLYLNFLSLFTFIFVYYFIIDF